jgi:1,6-anhydro-N-acetylmuramate kinase
MTPTRKRSSTEKAMTVAGIMSGTSADGIDVALVRIAPGVHGPKIKLLAHHEVPFSKQQPCWLRWTQN